MTIIANALNLSFRGQTFSSFTADDTFIIPDDVVSIYGRVWAAGGGGGYNAAGSRAASGGGGAYVEGFLSVIPGSTLTITVGVGGAGGATGGSDQTGGTGGDSSVVPSVGPTLVAKGGIGGGGGVSDPGGAGGSGPSSTGALKISGGNGAEQASVTSEVQGGSSPGNTPTMFGTLGLDGLATSGQGGAGGQGNGLGGGTAGGDGGSGLVLIYY